MKSFRLLPSIPRDDVHVQVEDVLVGCSPVLLDDAYAVGVYCLFYGLGDFFGDLMHFAEQFAWGVKDVFVMLFWNNQSVPLINWSNIQKSQYIIVFVNQAGGRLFLGYFTKDAVIVKLQRCSPINVQAKVSNTISLYFMASQYAIEVFTL